MLHKFLKSGRCPICGGRARKVGKVYVCDSCKITFNEFGMSNFAHKVILNYGTNFEFDIFGHPDEEVIKENLN